MVTETRREYLIHLWERIKARVYTRFLSSCFFEIGEGSTIIPPFRFFGLSGMRLGSRVTIHRECWVQTLVASDDDASPKLIIGNNVSIGMGATISAAEKIAIEDHVFFARNVYVSDHGHQYEDIARPIASQGIRKVAPVRIGANTWVGQNAVVLPGVTIGRNCVVGANSVVNRDIPDFSIAAGVPAKVVRIFNFDTDEWEDTKVDE